MPGADPGFEHRSDRGESARLLADAPAFKLLQQVGNRLSGDGVVFRQTDRNAHPRIEQRMRTADIDALRCQRRRDCPLRSAGVQ